MEYKAELLLREVTTVGPEAGVAEVARLMLAKHIGSVVVTENGEIAGVLTERDILYRVVAMGVDPATAKVKDHMTTEPHTVDRSEPLEKVFELLSMRRFRHVPITDGGRPVGMVSLSDFAGVLKEVFGEEKYLQYFVDYMETRKTF